MLPAFAKQAGDIPNYVIFPAIRYSPEASRIIAALTFME
jgi:hypothetical protein